MLQPTVSGFKTRWINKKWNLFFFLQQPEQFVEEKKKKKNQSILFIQPKITITLSHWAKVAQSCYVGTINNPQPTLWTDPYYKNPFSREEKNQTGPWSVWARRWLQTRIEGFTWCHFNLHFLFLVCFVHQRRRLFKAPSAFSTRPSQTLSIWLLLKCKQITSASINPAAEGGREGGLQPCREQQTDRKMKCIKESIMLFFFSWMLTFHYSESIKM